MMRNKLLSVVIVFLVCLLFTTRAEAKIVKLTLADGSVRAFTSSQLSSISIDDEGIMVVKDYNGEVIESFDADLSTLELTDEPVITEMPIRELTFADENLKTKREVMSLNMLYPSIDPDGNPVTLSGAIHIPTDILYNKEKSKGIMLITHSTTSNREECPTRGYLRVESMFLAYYTLPMYIIVESDLYGFGATERFPQAYLYGMTNAHATLDALIAARKILNDIGINSGERLFNIGYSSGGYDAVATLRLADEEYSDCVKIDHTMAGAGPLDISLMYNIIAENDSTAYPVAMPLVLVSYNESAHLGLDYNEVFQPAIAEKLNDWILAKNYSTEPLCDSIGTHHLTEIFTKEFLDDSEGKRKMLELMEKHSMVKGWTPNPDAHIYYYHGTDDTIVPQECGKAFVQFLKDEGYTYGTYYMFLDKPDLDVNLQTTFVPWADHIPGAAAFARQVQKFISAYDEKDEENNADK